MKLVLAAAVALLASTPVWAVETPEALVARVYAEEGGVIAPAKLRRYYSRDLAAALKKDQNADGVGAIGFDWLYGAQDFDISELTFESRPYGPDLSFIEARFLNFGKPVVVQWTLCRHPNGDWRVRDVMGEGWDLRYLLEISLLPISC